MAMQINKSKQSKSWDTYWQGMGESGAYSSGGVNHPLIHAFWDDFFRSQQDALNHATMIDIASGNGAVIKQVLTVFSDPQFKLTSLDISSAAIDAINAKFPMVNGIVADAASIPFQSGTFDLVSSQFGVEYAGQEAIYEAARLVADDGYLTLVLHSQSSSIEQECQQSLDATRRLQESGFIEKTTTMFEAAFAAMTGADRTPYEIAAKQLAPAITALEEIMREYGPHVAGDTIIRLYNDVDQIHQKIQRVDPDEVLNWLAGMQDELAAYAERMASMSRAAISAGDFFEIKTQLENNGFTLEHADALVEDNHQKMLAWSVIARKLPSLNKH